MQELQSDKRTKSIDLDTADGSLKVKASAAALTARIDSDYLLHQALLRRGLAYDQAGLLDLDIHSQWIAVLFDHLVADPIPSHRMPTVAHLLAADKALFVK
eukprot:889724-Amphidinium_carterae.1